MNNKILKLFRITYYKVKINKEVIIYSYHNHYFMYSKIKISNQLIQILENFKIYAK